MLNVKIKSVYVYDEEINGEQYKGYYTNICGFRIETLIRERDNKHFYSSSDILKMCGLDNRGSYSSNLAKNSKEIVKTTRKSYVDGYGMFSYIFKGRNEGISNIKDNFIEIFEQLIDYIE